MLSIIFLTLLMILPTKSKPLTPQMGWNTWNTFKLNFNQTTLQQTADLLVSTGLKDAGYEYLIIDDGWQASTRGEDGRQRANTSKFPDGMPTLARYVHERGLKLGIYSDSGIHTCGFQPGSWGYEELDAATYAEWGVDYLKYDNCGSFQAGVESPQDRFGKMRDALLNSGRDILYSICQWGMQFPWYWAHQMGHSYRISGDITATFSDTGKDCACRTAYCLNTGYAGCSVLTIIRKMREISPFNKPGSFADMDSLEVGVADMTLHEQRTHMSFWAALKSPLIIGADLSKLSNETLAVVKNKEIIKISQDKLGMAVRFVEELSVEREKQVWVGELSGKRTVVLILNESANTDVLDFDLGNVPGLDRKTSYAVLDVWSAYKQEGVKRNYRLKIESYETKVIIFSRYSAS